jgi:hypothetical protein
MNPTRRKVINSKAVTVTQFPGMEGLRIWTKLIKMLGPSLSTMGKALGGIDLSGGIDQIKFENILSSGSIDFDKLFSSISEAIMQADLEESIVEEMVLRILSCTKVEGKEIDISVFNYIFAGNYGFLFKVIAFVLEVNYSNFLGGKDNSTHTDTPQSLSQEQN